MIREEYQNQQQIAGYLALLRVSGLGPRRTHYLLEQFHSVDNILAAAVDGLKEHRIPATVIAGLQKPDWQAVERDIAWLDASPVHHFIPYGDPRYPALLKEISDPPVGLFVKGNLDVLGNLQIAVVGSRNPTPAGKRIAHDFAAELAALDITVTSGLALGIDSQSHTGALTTQGTTIAVLGNGLANIYPTRNRNLAEEILSQGALVSEFPPDIKPVPENFPRRNRIISGMSLGVLVVEAATRSGSLITARHAMEQGREVFAIPSSIHNSRAKGCHILIKQGAKLTEEIRDILEEIGPLTALLGTPRNKLGETGPDQEGLDARAKLLLHNIGDSPVTIDILVDMTTLSVETISGLLPELELKGFIETLPGGTYIRRG